MTILAADTPGTNPVPDEGDDEEVQENKRWTGMSTRRPEEAIWRRSSFPLVGTTMEEAVSLAHGRVQTQTEVAIILERHERGREVPIAWALQPVGTFEFKFRDTGDRGSSSISSCTVGGRSGPLQRFIPSILVYPYLLAALHRSSPRSFE